MGSHQSLSVVLADDNIAFRQGLKTLLGFFQTQDNLNVNVVGEAASADQAINLAIEQHPRLLLLDLEMQTDRAGEKTIQALRDQNYQGKILVLSAHQEDEYIFRSMQAGANGYLFKFQLSSYLHQAIHTVLNHEIFLAPGVATRFFRSFHFSKGGNLLATTDIRLTDREKEVLDWLVQGETNQSIASHLNITIATVKAHLTAVFEKLEVKSRSQAIVKALKLGLVSP